MLAHPGYGIGDMELFLVTLESELDVCPGNRVDPLTLQHEETKDRAALTARIDTWLRGTFLGT
ncbi:hypothetical protein ACFWBC_05235 [Streptomyces sp. NPDC059985]|uniref:hypothetical protein n=1 Tax=Streptomyces sp. NPDC059985 TaxID=3347025 RepID=UPI00369CE0A6